MSKSKIIFGVIVAAIVAFGGACQPPTVNKESAQSNSTVIATADRGYALTVRDFYSAIYNSRNKVEGGVLSDDEFQWLRDSLAVDTLTGYAADDLELGKYYSDHWVYRSRYISVLVNAYYTRHIASQITVDSADVIDFHKNHPERFSVTEQGLANHIMVSPVTFREGPDSLKNRKLSPDQLEGVVKEYANHLRRLVDSGMPFQEVAKQYSHDITTKNQAGAMGWVNKDVYRPPFDSVLFSMKPGEYSQPYRDADGWHILQLADYLAAGPTPLDRPTFFDQAKQALTGERQAAVLRTITDSLSKGIDLQINPIVLDTDVFLVPDSLWCAVVNQVDTIDVQTIKTMDDAFRSRYQVANTTPDMKRVIIGSFVQRQLMVQAARRDGLDTFPEIRKQQHDLWHNTGKSLLIRQWYDRSWRPSDSVVADYYARHPKQFLVEKPLKVQQIVTKDSASALFLRDQAMSGVDFMELAREYYPGEPTVRDALADLGYIGPRDVDTAFYMAAFGTMVNEVSMPVKSRYGFHIIKVVERNESKSLDNARIDIVRRFSEQFRKDEMLKRKAELAAIYHLRYPNHAGRLFFDPSTYRTR